MGRTHKRITNDAVITIYLFIFLRMQEGGEMGFDEDYEVNGLDPRMWDSDNDWYQIYIFNIYFFILFHVFVVLNIFSIVNTKSN